MMHFTVHHRNAEVRMPNVKIDIEKSRLCDVAGCRDWEPNERPEYAGALSG